MHTKSQINRATSIRKQEELHAVFESDVMGYVGEREFAAEWRGFSWVFFFYEIKRDGISFTW